MQAGVEQSIQIILEEYRALYGLLQYRLASIERRVPAAGIALAATLGGILLLPPAAQIVILVGLPITLYWFVWTTVTHAQSFEDLVRRIEEIEKAVNDLTGEQLLLFQSSHPSRRRSGGRTGARSVAAVTVGCGAVLVACIFLATEILDELPYRYAYTFYALGVLGLIVAAAVRLRRYRYTKEA